VRSSLQDGHKNIDIDLSQTTYVDSCGLGALVALHKTACGRKGAVRLLSPQRPVQQILELTRMHRIFQIVQPPAEPPVGSAPQAPALVAVQKSS
ncbi:MAG TPA: STAS domain-containing protein, partial [Verrucomicrobiae bacterium]|nr:STAS domain-containing protein [Verrucomicrobiae bacterium]